MSLTLSPISSGDGYTTYVPTWTATGTAPDIGNATVVGRYSRVGKTVYANGSIVFGSSSNFGTGAFLFALPVTANATVAAASILIPGVVYLLDASGAVAMAVANFASATTMSIILPATYLGAQTNAGQTSPWTWAQSDKIGWNLVYEAA